MNSTVLYLVHHDGTKAWFVDGQASGVLQRSAQALHSRFPFNTEFVVSGLV